MKKIFLMMIMAAAVVACQKEPAATAVIDENGDCIFQNDVVCFRLNGARNPVVTNGMEAILKAVVDKETVVRDRKAAKAASMNDGGSAILVGDSLCFPHENFDSFEVVELTEKHVTFSLTYPQWLAGEDSIKLTRTITLREGSYYCEVTDVYDIRMGKNITVYAGFEKRAVENSEQGNDYIVAWESVPGEGYMGIGLVMPMTRDFEFDGPSDQAVGILTTKSGRIAKYAVGYCWSKGEFADFSQWAEKVRL